MNKFFINTTTLKPITFNPINGILMTTSERIGRDLSVSAEMLDKKAPLENYSTTLTTSQGFNILF